VRESSYYAWLRLEPSARAIENIALLKQIKDLWHHFRGIYGAPRRFICWNEKTSIIDTGSFQIMRSDPSGKKLEHQTSHIPQIIEFLHCIAFPQSAKFAYLVTT